jgi:peptidoglycan/LPS O-acetylase OafA/YrhL
VTSSFTYWFIENPGRRFFNALAARVDSRVKRGVVTQYRMVRAPPP